MFSSFWSYLDLSSFLIEESKAINFSLITAYLHMYFYFHSLQYIHLFSEGSMPNVEPELITLRLRVTYSTKPARCLYKVFSVFSCIFSLTQFVFKFPMFHSMYQISSFYWCFEFCYWQRRILNLLKFLENCFMAQHMLHLFHVYLTWMYILLLFGRVVYKCQLGQVGWLQCSIYLPILCSSCSIN